MPGYSALQLVHDGRSTAVFRAVRLSDGKPVVIKLLKDGPPSRETVTRFHNEFQLASSLRLDPVVRVLGFETVLARPAFLMEDFGADALARLCADHPFSQLEALRIGAQAAIALDALHHAGFVHGDVSPHNIVCHADSGVVKLIDFGSARYLSRDHAQALPAGSGLGTLAYMSPEQTGRVNCAFDHRSDLYSLGATLYELLLHRPLFNAGNAAEWFHGHIARQPVPPHQVDPTISKVVSDLVMKLLAKSADARYQSARGLYLDLETCIAAMEADGDPVPFALARRDVPMSLQFSLALHGREDDVARLLLAFTGDPSSAPAFTLVSGAAGIGKTALVEQLRPAAAAANGFFLESRGDPTQRGIPYSALSPCLRELLRQLLTHEAQRLADWKHIILEATGSDAQLLCEFLPEAGLVLGEQPPVEPLPPAESERRFHAVLRRFLGVFGQRGHPLVVFIDDIQWADGASLGFVETLVASEVRHLLIVGACRSTDDLPLYDRLNARGVQLHRLDVMPMHPHAVCTFVAETLQLPVPEAAPLAEALAGKTGGNPFFIKEFLLKLHRDGVLAFDAEAGRYLWDLDAVRAATLTDNLAEHMLAKLSRLPDATLALVKLAACIGGRFPLEVLSQLVNESQRKTGALLHAAVMSGLVVPVRDGISMPEFRTAKNGQPVAGVAYAFSHERIRQSAYGLLDEAQRTLAHTRIGRILDEALTQQARDDQLFAVAGHLNHGAPTANARERRTLCSLNIECGIKATRAGSHEAGFEHFQLALSLLDAGSWYLDRELTFDLHVKLAEAAYITRHYDVLQSTLDAGLARAKTPLERLSLHEVQIQACIAQGQMGQAVDIARLALASAGLRFPSRPRRLHVLAKLMGLRWRLARIDSDTLRSLPKATDPLRLATQRVCWRAASAVMFADPELHALMAFDLTRQALAHGYSSATPWALESVATLYARLMGDVERADQLGRLGIEISEKIGVTASPGRTMHIYSAMVQHWREPLRSTLPSLGHALRACNEEGNHEWGAHASMVRARHALLAGCDLTQLEQEIVRDTALFRSIGHGAMLNHHASTRQVIQNLQGRAARPGRLVGEAYDIEASLPLHLQARDHSLALSVRRNQLLVSYLFGDTAEALELAEHLDAARGSSSAGFYTLPWGLFMTALVWLRAATRSSGAARRRLIARASANLRTLRRLAKINPASYRHKVHLLEAELLRVRGKELEAHLAFDLSIRCAHEHEWVNEAALAHELCGDMHMNAGRTTLARPYLAQAVALYEQWGASAKAEDVKQRFPGALPRAAVGDATARSTQADVDLGLLTKALTTIAGEQVHSRMVASVIRVALELAGAQRGALVLRNPRGEFCVEAEADADGEAKILHSVPVASCPSINQAVVHQVTRTGLGVVVDDARAPGGPMAGLHLDPDVAHRGLRSVLCLPITAGHEGAAELIGVLYLENKHLTKCFTPERFSTLQIICLSAAGRIELSRKAAVDGLTQLFNHDYFQNMLRQEIAVASRHQRHLSIVLCDIDHFKRFNDTWGHQVGDKVLMEVASTLKHKAREGDVVARYGGEEMALILPSTSLHEAVLVAERMRAAIAALQVESGAGPIGVTASFGISTLRHGTSDAASLVREADAALYRSKREGRNRVSGAELAEA